MAEKKNVRIRLFKDNSRYKGDLFVSVNGVNYKIRRGVEVVPASDSEDAGTGSPDSAPAPGPGSVPSVLLPETRPEAGPAGCAALLFWGPHL